MPAYRYEQSFVTRSKGKNVVATAAYHAGENLQDRGPQLDPASDPSRTRETLAHAAYQAGENQRDGGRHFNFAAKAAGVLHKEILTPEHAPVWTRDREELWNRADDAETKCNARLARKLIMSLPAELTLEANIELVRGFLAERFVAQGMVADFAIHRPDHDADDRHIHAHVLLTRRELTPEGFGKLYREAEQGRALVQDRKAWEKHINTALEREGVHERVSADSHYARGIVREPEPVMGDKAIEEQRRRKHSRQGTLDERTQERIAKANEVRMRNGLRAEHDRKGEPHPEWLMDYYRRGRQQWFDRQQRRIDRVKARGNIHFAAKLERDLAQAKEKGVEVDRAHRQGHLRADQRQTREEIARPRWQEAEAARKQAEQARQNALRDAQRDAEQQSKAKERSVPPPREPDRAQARTQERGNQPSTGRSQPAPMSREGLSAAARAGAARIAGEGGRSFAGGSAGSTERATRLGEGGFTPREGKERAGKHDPALDRHGNRRETGDSLLSTLDQLASDLRSSFPHRQANAPAREADPPTPSWTTEEEWQSGQTGKFVGPGDALPGQQPDDLYNSAGSTTSSRKNERKQERDRGRD